MVTFTSTGNSSAVEWHEKKRSQQSHWNTLKSLQDKSEIKIFLKCISARLNAIYFYGSSQIMYSFFIFVFLSELWEWLADIWVINGCHEGCGLPVWTCVIAPYCAIVSINGTSRPFNSLINYLFSTVVSPFLFICRTISDTMRSVLSSAVATTRVVCSFPSPLTVSELC